MPPYNTHEEEVGPTKNNFNFVPPSLYAKINGRHLALNNQLLQEYGPEIGPLDDGPLVVDFGCGTGETTAGIAQGDLLPWLSRPKVLGLDLSPEMVQHCREEHGHIDNAKFRTFDFCDPDQKARMLDLLEGRVDLVVCFTVLHWVSNQMEAIDFLRKILKPGSGKILMYLLTGHPPSNVCRSTFQDMKEDMPDLMGDMEYRHDGLTFEDGQYWQANFAPGLAPDEDTLGSILPQDYRALLEASGLNCLDFQYQPQAFRVPPHTIDMYLDKKVLGAYREKFANTNLFDDFAFEFKTRIQDHTMTYGKLEIEYDGLKILAQPSY